MFPDHSFRENSNSDIFHESYLSFFFYKYLINKLVFKYGTRDKHELIQNIH